MTYPSLTGQANSLVSCETMRHVSHCIIHHVIHQELSTDAHGITVGIIRVNAMGNMTLLNAAGENRWIIKGK